MNFQIHYHETVVKEDIPRLPKNARNRIKSAVETKLTTRPDLFGKPLRRSLKGYRKLRMGDYRIVFHIEEGIVKIFVIEHRSKVYSSAVKRLS